MFDLTHALIAIISYSLGLLSGVIVGKTVNKSGDEGNSTLVLIIVTIIWAMSMVVDIISPTYETSPLVHGLMGAIVGFYYKQRKSVWN